jgi:hypothetical protein
MSITDRTRKILWVRAGGRCSICHEQLATDATDKDDSSVFGEECHIVARSPIGPRAADIVDVDAYENLILLCHKHHKQVDDQCSYFTVERLRKIKREHEKREADRSGSVRLIADPTKPTPKILKLSLTGETLWQVLDGALSFNPYWPTSLSDEQGDAIDNLLDELRDWLDVASELSYKEKRQAVKVLDEHMKRLGDVGLFVGIRDRHMLLTGGVSDDPFSWRGFDVEFQPVAEAQLVDPDGKPVTPPATGQ